MSVKIEILDYNGIIESGGGTSTGFDLTSGTVNYCGLGNITVTSSTLQYTNPGGATIGCYLMDTSTLIHGATYTFHYNVTALNKISGAAPSGRVWVLLDSAITQTFNSSSGMQSIVFTYDSSNPTGYQLQILNCNSATISNVSITGVATGGNVDWANSVVGELDVTDHSDFPIAMTFQISDIKDITSTSGDYSKTFKLPATKNNNKILRHPFATNVDEDVNVNENRKCRITINDSYYLLGLIKVTGVGGYGETPSHYDCVFYGNNLNWADDLSNKYMHELDWGSGGGGLTYNKTSIRNTWFDVDCDASSSPIVYPITSYGDYNPEGMENTIQLLDTITDALGYLPTKLGYYGFMDSGISYGTPMPSPDWRPAIFVKDTLEKIFANAGHDGYTINSSFMETDMFKKLVWLLPNFEYNNPNERFSKYGAEAIFDTSYGVVLPTQNFAITYSAAPSFANEWDSALLDFGTINTNFVLSDDTSSTDIVWNTGFNGFTVAEYGKYTIRAKGLSLKLDTLLQDGSVPASFYLFTTTRQTEYYIEKIEFRLQVRTVGQTSWNDIASAEEATETGFVGSVGLSIGNNALMTSTMPYVWDIPENIEFETFLNKGDKVRMRIVVSGRPHNDVSGWDGNGTWSFNGTPTIENFDIGFEPNRVEYGQTYDLNKVMNLEYKQLDFVKGIAHAFNLKMTTDEVTRVVTLEPFDTFYKDYAEAIDWTYKLDRSKQIDDKWIKTDLKRDIVFKYKSDSKDKKVEHRGLEYFDGIKDEYPYQETLPKSFERGESKFENPFFAGTFNAKDQDTTGISGSNNPYSACLWSENASANYSKPDKGYEFLPRLLYWNKYSPSGLSLSWHQKFAKVEVWGNTFEFIVADASASGGVFLIGVYPQATSINRDDTSSPVLSYGNAWVRDYDDATNTYSSYEVGSGLFETYYKNMFEMFKEKPRLRTAYIDLKVKDIVNLDFTKLVYIDGVYWRISRVVDYQPNKNESTKVELVEWQKIGTFAATTPSFGSGGTTSGWGTLYGGYGDPAPNNPNQGA